MIVTDLQCIKKEELMNIIIIGDKADTVYLPGMDNTQVSKLSFIN